MLAGEIAKAAQIARFMREAIDSRPMAGPWAMDSYNFFPMLNNYIFSGLNMSGITLSDELPFKKRFEKYFEDANIYIKSSEYYYSILGISKGGVLKIFDKNRKKLICSDCGYWGRLKSGKVVSSQSLDTDRKVILGDNRAELTSHFSNVRQKVFSPFLFIIFRFVTLFLEIFPFKGYFVKYILTKTLICGKGKIACSLLRTVRYDEQEISVMDRIIGLDKVELNFLARGDKFTTVHMGSSKYFQKSELIATTLKGNDLMPKVKDAKEIILEEVIKI